jgi:hypothetical protein
LEHISAVELLDFMVNSSFNFSRNHPAILFFHSGCTIVHAHQQK